MKTILSTLTICFACIGLSTSVWSQAVPAETPSAKPASAAMKSTDVEPTPTPAARPFRGRLPRYFASLVDDGQRLEIYRIQQAYHAEIEQLQARLMALKQQEQSEIEQVLTAQQRKQLDMLRATSLARRSSAATPAASPAGSQASAEPAEVSPDAGDDDT